MNILLFEQISVEGNAAYKTAMNIYTDAFPLQERHPAQLIRERVQNGHSLLYTGRIEHEIVFMALLWPLQHTQFILLDYMATHDEHRGKGIASSFLRYMEPWLQKTNTHFILETEDPESGTNKNERRNRIEFYRRNGARRLKEMKYKLPALQGTISTEMVLMIFPDYEKGSIEARLVKSLIIQIYKELYGRNRDEALRDSSGLIGKTMIELV